VRRWPGAVNEAGGACCRSEPTFISLGTPKLESTPAPQGDSTELAEVLRARQVMPGEQRERYRFPRASRLSRAAEFKLVKQAGKSWTGRHLVLGVLAQEDETRARVGIVTTRKVGMAVVRNRIRRRIREVFRLHQFDLISGVWLVTVARPSAARASFQELERDWLRLAERASILARS
jgi:ribonuclease P protein component